MCVSAAGHFLPPMLIFPRSRLTDQLKKGAPAESVFSCNGSGWMTIADFNIWFNHFLAQTRPSPQAPVLLLLDGHASHVKNLTLIEKARNNNVTILCFPPHCSHKLQPLDVAFMGPFKTNVSLSIEKYLKQNPGKVVTLNEISSLVGNAFSQTAVPATAINGFRKTGIVPFNKYIFNETDFAPSMVTDVPIEDDGDSDGPFLGFEDDMNGMPSVQAPVEFTSNIQHATSQVRPVEDLPHLCHTANKQPPTTKAFKVSPEAILPLAKTTTRKVTRNRRKGKTANITASLYRDELQKSLAAKDISDLQK
ncbi:uncharacterized protein LOC134219646 [Armigeres subalbatus]|uniref:uncharacterized protein LOC134219646 n=1 Tax=Armigeres subalbatus TaxID=124917 RepID=UPI002ED2F2FC